MFMLTILASAIKMLCFIPIDYVVGVFYKLKEKIEENKFIKLFPLLIISKSNIFAVIKNQIGGIIMMGNYLKQIIHVNHIIIDYIIYLIKKNQDFQNLLVL